MHSTVHVIHHHHHHAQKQAEPEKEEESLQQKLEQLQQDKDKEESAMTCIGAMVCVLIVAGCFASYALAPGSNQSTTMQAGSSATAGLLLLCIVLAAWCFFKRPS